MANAYGTTVLRTVFFVLVRPERLTAYKAVDITVDTTDFVVLPPRLVIALLGTMTLDSGSWTKYRSAEITMPFIQFASHREKIIVQTD